MVFHVQKHDMKASSSNPSIQVANLNKIEAASIIYTLMPPIISIQIANKMESTMAQAISNTSSEFFIFHKWIQSDKYE